MTSAMSGWGDLLGGAGDALGGIADIAGAGMSLFGGDKKVQYKETPLEKQQKIINSMRIASSWHGRELTRQLPITRKPWLNCSNQVD